MSLFGKKQREEATQALAELRAELAQLREQLTAADAERAVVDARLTSLAQTSTDQINALAHSSTEQIATLHLRLQSVSTELANQLSELGHDIDALAAEQHTGGSAVDGEAIEALRAGQVRLANEQARYEIAFRADLAELAERVRRIRG